MSPRRKPPQTSASLSRKVTFALTGAGLAVMSLPLVTAVLPSSASAARAPMGGGSTSIGVTSVVPTASTVAKSTLPVLTGTVTTFTPGVTQFTVSSGICTVEVLASGAAGGNVNGGIGGRGTSIRGQFAVSAGATYTLTVGAYRGGGSGGLPELNGGGASKVVQNSNNVVVVEAAGGGGDALATITRINAAQDTIPRTTLTGSTNPPFIQVAVNPGKGGDAPGTTAVSPQTATVSVPVGDAASPVTSTSLVTKTVSAAANGSNLDSDTGVLSRNVAPGTTQFIASAQVNVFAGGVGGGGSAASGGAASDGGIAGTINYPTTTLPSSDGGPFPPTTWNFNAPYAIGAAVGGSGGQNTIGNGFLTLAQGINDQLDGRIMVRQIACSTSGSTLPPLGGGRGASGPLLPAAIVLLGAGAGLLAVRRRGNKLAPDAQ